MKYSILIISLSIPFLSINAVAEPTITDIAWEAGSVTLHGTDFGEFNGEILSWDDFEGHAINSTINNTNDALGNTWTTIYNYNGLGIKVTDENAISGQKSLKVDWSIDEYSIRAFGWAGKPPFDTVYITYWRKMTGGYNPSNSNHKQFYLYGTNSEFPQLMPLVEAKGDRWGVYNNVGDASVSYEKRSNFNSLGWIWGNTIDKFQRWEFYAKLNSPYTESNGVIQVRLDGKLGINTNDYRTGYVDGQWKDLRIGHMAQGFTSSAKAWFDDVYVATSRARVEACDTPVYEECTIKHLQLTYPENWTNTEIVFSPKNLKYMKGYPTYIFVVKSNGDVSLPIPAPRALMN